MKTKDIETGKDYAYTTTTRRETGASRVHVIDAEPVYAETADGEICKKGDGTSPNYLHRKYGFILVEHVVARKRGVRRRRVVRPRDIVELWEPWSRNRDAIRKQQHAEYQAQEAQDEADEEVRDDVSAQLDALGIPHGTSYRAGEDISLSSKAALQLLALVRKAEAS